MTSRRQIPFDDMLENLWIQAYREIVSIIQEKQLVDRIVHVTIPSSEITGVYVNDTGVLSFLHKSDMLKFAEEFSDTIMFETYKAVFEQYYGKE